MRDENGGSPIRYQYNYDTLGRLIGTSQKRAGRNLYLTLASSTYANGDNLLSSVAQCGNTIGYGYSGAFHREFAKATGLVLTVPCDGANCAGTYFADAYRQYQEMVFRPNCQDILRAIQNHTSSGPVFG